MAFVWELTKETIHLPLGCLQGGVGVFYGESSFTQAELECVRLETPRERWSFSTKRFERGAICTCHVRMHSACLRVRTDPSQYLHHRRSTRNGRQPGYATRHVLPTKASKCKATCLQCAGQPDTRAREGPYPVARFPCEPVPFLPPLRRSDNNAPSFTASPTSSAPSSGPRAARCASRIASNEATGSARPAVGALRRSSRLPAAPAPAAPGTEPSSAQSSPTTRTAMPAPPEVNITNKVAHPVCVRPSTGTAPGQRNQNSREVGPPHQTTRDLQMVTLLLDQK